MTALAAHPAGGVAYAPPLRASLERFRGGVLWLTGFSGAFVFMEPSPYEIASFLAVVTFIVTGLSLKAALTPLIVMLLLYDIGFSLAVLKVIDQTKLVIWVVVSWYLSATAIFFAAALQTNTQARVDLLARGFVAGAVIAAIVGVLAYFHVLGDATDIFLRYDRARGTFNDPNVLGAFLIFPSLLALQKVMSGSPAQMLKGGLLLGLFAVTLLVTFSRAAWGQFAGTAALLMFFTFITTRSTKQQLRIVVISVLGIMVLALLITALLSTDRVAELFTQRASLDQEYDVGRFGRFGRYTLGMLMALDNPFGIGPLQFALIFTEDPHNTFLNAFMSGGWLSGILYATIVLSTLVMGFRFVFVATPWRNIYLAVYCAFIGVAVESAIIDVDHWRHFFLLLGVMWGLMAASRSYMRRAPRPA